MTKLGKAICTGRMLTAQIRFMHAQRLAQFIELLVEVEWCRPIAEQGASDYDA